MTLEEKVAANLQHARNIRDVIGAEAFDQWCAGLAAASMKGREGKDPTTREAQSALIIAGALFLLSHVLQLEDQP